MIHSSAEPSSFLLVDHLPRSLSCAGLRFLCERVGPVLFAKVVRVVRGAHYDSMGFGYVQMESAEAAQRTLQSLHLSNMKGEILAVSFIKRLSPGYGP
jgi:hypothetical protein